MNINAALKAMEDKDIEAKAIWDEVAKLKAENERLKEEIKLKDMEIGMLRGDKEKDVAWIEDLMETILIAAGACESFCIVFPSGKEYFDAIREALERPQSVKDRIKENQAKQKSIHDKEGER
jgi:c-di-AMP phosphodiesterase-like protein